MKPLLVVVLLFVSVQANAGARFEAGLARHSSTTSYGSGSSTSNKTAAVVGAGYLQDLDGFSVEGNVSLSSPSLKDVDTSPLRFEANLVKGIGDRFRVKAGPSVSHFTNNSGVIERTAYGYQIAGEADLNERSFVSAGFYNSLYKGSALGTAFKTSADSLQIRIGFSF